MEGTGYQDASNAQVSQLFEVVERTDAATDIPARLGSPRASRFQELDSPMNLAGADCGEVEREQMAETEAPGPGGDLRGTLRGSATD